MIVSYELPEVDLELWAASTLAEESRQLPISFCVTILNKHESLFWASLQRFISTQHSRERERIEEK